MEPECKVAFLTWYQANKITADRIINDLKKQSFEAVMHLYAYTAKSLKLEHIVSQRDIPILFSNNYTRVGDTIVTAIVFLLSEGNINFLCPNRIKNTLRYWLFLWQSVRNDCLKNHRQDWWSPWTIREERLFRFTAALSWDQHPKWHQDSGWLESILWLGDGTRWWM